MSIATLRQVYGVSFKRGDVVINRVTGEQGKVLGAAGSYFAVRVTGMRRRMLFHPSDLMPATEGGEA